MPCSRYLGVSTLGVSAHWGGLLRGCLLWGGFCSPGGGLLLWPSVGVFCYGLLVWWPSCVVPSD